MSTSLLKIDIEHQIATLSLNRPAKRNALNAELLQELANALKNFVDDEKVAVVILKGEGDCFCAGGDIATMQRLAHADQTSNYQDTQLLADVLFQLHTLPKPVIAIAHGKVLGGGVGLIAAADIVLAADNTQFAFPEVSLGITPSIVSPYVIAAIGERLARYYFLTTQSITAAKALTLHLVHEVHPIQVVNAEAKRLAEQLKKLSALALSEVKNLVRGVSKESMTLALAHKTAEHLADIRALPEAQEGLLAFLEKRKPNWE